MSKTLGTKRVRMNSFNRLMREYDNGTLAQTPKGNWSRDDNTVKFKFCNMMFMKNDPNKCCVTNSAIRRCTFDNAGRISINDGHLVFLEDSEKMAKEYAAYKSDFERRVDNTYQGDSNEDLREYLKKAYSIRLNIDFKAKTVITTFKTKNTIYPENFISKHNLSIATYYVPTEWFSQDLLNQLTPENCKDIFLQGVSQNVLGRFTYKDKPPCTFDNLDDPLFFSDLNDGNGLTPVTNVENGGYDPLYTLVDCSEGKIINITEEEVTKQYLGFVLLLAQANPNAEVISSAGGAAQIYYGTVATAWTQNDNRNAPVSVSVAGNSQTVSVQSPLSKKGDKLAQGQRVFFAKMNDDSLVIINAECN